MVTIKATIPSATRNMIAIMIRIPSVIGTKTVKGSHFLAGVSTDDTDVRCWTNSNVAEDVEGLVKREGTLEIFKELARMARPLV